MEQTTQQLKARYNIGSYISIWYSDGNGNREECYIPEAELPSKIRLNRPLVVRPCVSFLREIKLGVVREVRNYVKRQHIEVRTDEGWYYIEVNKPLEILLGDRFHWCELLDDELNQISSEQQSASHTE